MKNIGKITDYIDTKFRYRCRKCNFVKHINTIPTSLHRKCPKCKSKMVAVAVDVYIEKHYDVIVDSTVEATKIEVPKTKTYSTIYIDLVNF